jgi:hypothetical protein
MARKRRLQQLLVAEGKFYGVLASSSRKIHRQILRLFLWQYTGTYKGTHPKVF